MQYILILTPAFQAIDTVKRLIPSASNLPQLSKQKSHILMQVIWVCIDYFYPKSGSKSLAHSLKNGTLEKQDI